MKKVVTVKGIPIGEGSPKICVSMIGKTVAQLIEEAHFMRTTDLDVVEWRVDFFEDVDDIEKVKNALEEIRAVLPDPPLLFTFRSVKEGGEREISAEQYVELNKAIIQTGQVDLVDIELFTGDEKVKALINVAHHHQVFVIISNHDFDKTPPKEEMVFRLRKAQELGGDIAKIAVMPHGTRDVLTLLEATVMMDEQYADIPIITMSMAGKGVISRLAGEIFGSALTFGAAKNTSAPGQVDVIELRRILSLLHRAL